MSSLFCPDHVRKRLVFGVQGEDADLLAHELASINFDPMRIKDEIWSRRQRVKGQRVIELTSWSKADAQSEQWKRDYGENWSSNEGVSRSYFSFEEDANVWAREIRNRPTGSAFLRLVDVPKLYDVDVKRSAVRTA